MNIVTGYLVNKWYFTIIIVCKQTLYTMAKKTNKSQPDISITQSESTVHEQKPAGFPESQPVKTKKSASAKVKPDAEFPESAPVKSAKAATRKLKVAESAPAETSITELVTNIAARKKKKAATAKTEKINLPVIPESHAEVDPQETLSPVEVYTRFTDFDIDLFKGGKHFKLYEKLGSHVVTHKNVVGTYFAVWAPNAQYVSVIGNFNGWNKGSHALNHRWDGSGIWEGFIPDIGNGEVYKYFIRSNSGELLEKGDPFALRWEEPPQTASIVADTYYEWQDQDWMANRYQHNALDKPYSVYELHLGSWARNNESPDEFLTYSQIADKLVPYIKFSLNA